MYLFTTQISSVHKFIYRTSSHPFRDRTQNLLAEVTDVLTEQQTVVAKHLLICESGCLVLYWTARSLFVKLPRHTAFSLVRSGHALESLTSDWLFQFSPVEYSGSFAFLTLAVRVLWYSGLFRVDSLAVNGRCLFLSVWCLFVNNGTFVRKPVHRALKYKRSLYKNVFGIGITSSAFLRWVV